MDLYPYSFQPIFRQQLWGSRRLEDFLQSPLPPGENIGEAWMIADRSNNGGPVSEVKNGPHQGTSLQELMSRNQEAILGKDAHPDGFGRFPLMIKFLDVRQDLSIQVHPPDEYARTNENDMGTIEAWYVIQATEEARVTRGILPGVGPEDLLEAIREDRPEDVLNSVPVQTGDIVLIPPGVVHSIGGDVLLCEIQKNSLATFRLYDWNRIGPEGKSRDLHLKDALEVIDFHPMGQTQDSGVELDGPGKMRECLLQTTLFEIHKLLLEESTKEHLPGNRYEILACIQGSGTLECESTDEKTISYQQGSCFLLPAAMGDYQIQPEVESEWLKVLPN